MEGAMSSKKPEAHPLIGFRLGQTQDTPTEAIIEMITSEGSNLYTAKKDSLKQMISWLQEMLDAMPDTK
jgi:hypothetical protein